MDEAELVSALKALADHPAARGLCDDAAVLEVGSETLVNTTIEVIVQEEEKFITGDVLLMLTGTVTLEQPDYVTERHDGEAWYNHERFTQTRANGKVTLALTEEGDPETGAWMNNNKVEFTYADSRVSVMESSFWVAEFSDWYLSFINRYEYDGHGNVSTMVVEMEGEEEGVIEPAIRVMLEWELATGTANEVETPQPSFSLTNYPNPFAGHTEVAFTLAKPGQVTLRVYDVMGREVATLAEGLFLAGTQRAAFVADFPADQRAVFGAHVASRPQRSRSRSGSTGSSGSRASSGSRSTCRSSPASWPSPWSGSSSSGRRAGCSTPSWPGSGSRGRASARCRLVLRRWRPGL